MIQRAAVNVIVFLLLCGAAWATFGRAIHAQFFFDDEPAIQKNDTIRQLWPLSGPLQPPREHPFSARPLVNLTAAINYHFGGLDPAGYRLVNMALHALSAMLLFGIVGRTLKLEHFRWLQQAGHVEWIATALAFAVALLWTVHPLQTESVCYVTQRTELMFGFCYLATLYSSLRYWLAETASGRITWLVLAMLACATGMASKEVMVSAPVIVLLFEWTFLKHDVRKAWHKSWPLYVGLALTWILLIYLIADSPRQMSAGFHLGVPFVTSWLTQANVVLLYLKLAFWPWPLLIYYDMGHVRSLSEALPGLLVVSALGAGTLVALWRRWSVGFLGAWFFIILSPTSLVPIISEVAAERRMYLPLAAVVVLVVVGGYWLGLKLVQRARAGGRQMAGPLAASTLVAATGLAVVLGAVSYHRLAAYQTEVMLWRDLLERQPQSDLARLSLAYALSNADRHEEAAGYYAEALQFNPSSPYFLYMSAKNLKTLGRHAEAVAQLRKALSLNSRFPEAHYDLGLVLLETGQIQEATEHFAEAARQKPTDAEFLAQYGKNLIPLGMYSEALAELDKALLLQPNNAETHSDFADALRLTGQYPKAVRQFRQALELDPNLRQAHFNLALTYTALGRQVEAIDQFEELLARFPDDAATHAALGKALLESAEYELAVEHLQRAVELRPELAGAYDSLGAALLEVGRIEEAIAELETAVRLAPQSAVSQFNLADAYAAAGRSVEALPHARQALELARSQQQWALVEQIETWLSTHPSTE
jgi:tetratricopeptide (TPR) repeat protein